MSDARPIYNKFTVTRNDGKDGPGQKHEACEYFVLDLTHDYDARVALEAYAEACHRNRPDLASSLRRWLIDAAHAAAVEARDD